MEFGVLIDCINNEISPLGYQPNNDAERAAYEHIVTRITSEYLTVANYVMLMAFSTGELQQAITQVAQNEINHMAKFFGFTRWQFKDSFLTRWGGMMRAAIALTRGQMKHRQSVKTVFTINQQFVKVFFLYEWTKLLILLQLWRWNQKLTPDSLNDCLVSSQSKMA